MGRDRRGPAPAVVTLAGQLAEAVPVGLGCDAPAAGEVTAEHHGREPGLAALLVASVPLWMALADRVINGQRIPRRGWVALVLGLAGIAVLARPSGNGALLPIPRTSASSRGIHVR
jgi:hypothetical protein